MNITNADYFTFNVDNTMFLTGQTGSGKSVLQDRLFERMVAGHTSDSLQFVLMDMTQCDFEGLQNNHSEFIQKYITGSSEALDALDEIGTLSDERIKSGLTKPMIFVSIEECDMAAIDPARFQAAITKINTNAKEANIKLIFSTSRPSPDIIPKDLLKTFDLTVSGVLASQADHDYLGVPVNSDQKNYEFIIVENKRV